ncbi:polyketide synthase [Rhodococcus sp. NKCM2511]|uniref:aminotransferase class I/II-fold pyridoxal phosphate-dependent enzyme n=1 Tax=Nocardiaceae TaxID=85025 RepID=UPI00050C2866|nr:MULTISPECIES: aminotransferase class I/II-fold pyridoxal phosphate-dependent enzyme [Rhodococcus]MBY4383694.1 aminotransferase class I/II-fold pyridoxal phosphate-dependent enzyme [Rhodococcus fascians]OZD49648.1 2-amino-3-ketobutyrate CoA ligase [Rhodococcus sp. 06-1477-1B]KQU37457.1 2-amino-3-ketobutyrate CoA ligase [Rhodococcus sp. Leaf233]MBY4398336.1 aminotransferase class I/II-fold pyridoxal phosphate-dependent enzyme [Rhodococcus fascians]MBY4407643.1 aminotransferase class I/II-fold
MSVDSREIARRLLARGGYSTVNVDTGPESIGRGPTAAEPAAAGHGKGQRSGSLADHPDVAATTAQFDGVDRMFAELGVPNPLYLPHDGTAGATIRQLDRDMINFGSFNYLGLSSDRRVMDAAKDAIDRYGTSVSGSRIVSGQIPLYEEFESALARIYDVDDTVITASGYLTNAAAVGYLLGKGDLAVCDTLVHSSIVSGTEWAGCRRVLFRHNDPDALEAILKMSRGSFARAMVILESHYSMDGDVAVLPELIAVARRYDCAVMVDEAHAFGVLGQRGLGIRELYDLPGDAVDLWMGTMSKALGSVGGFLAGSRELIRGFKYSAPGLSMFTAGPAPSAVAAANMALNVLTAEPDRVERLRENGRYAFTRARSHGFDTGTAEGTSILPIVIGDTQGTVLACVALLHQGINVNAITYPSVPVGQERLRFFLSSEHTHAQIDAALTALASFVDGVGAPGAS